MRFFSRGWATGDLTDHESERARAEYLARVEEIFGDLPVSMRELGRETNLHDAFIERVVWTPASKDLLLVLVTGSSVLGYQTVSLAYRGAQLGRELVRSTERAALNRQTQVLYDEIDIDEEGLLVHRILFWPCEEVSIAFGALDLKKESRADSRVHLGSGFIERDPDDDTPLSTT